MALADTNAFRVTLRKSDDRPLLDDIQKLIKKGEGQKLSDAATVRRALAELRGRLKEGARR